MARSIILPELGALEVTLSLWLVAPGETVYEGDRVAEVLAGSSTFEVAAPCTGQLVQRLTRPGDRLTPGQPLGTIQEPQAPG